MRNCIAVVALALLAACSQQSSSSRQASSPVPSPTNPLDFPTYEGSQILATRDWKETVSPQAAAGDRSVFTQGAGTYSGHEVIAQTPASAAQVESWIRSVSEKPPAGYSVAASADALDEVHRRARLAGIDFEAFQHQVNGKTRGLLVLVVDPEMLNAKAGPMLGMVSKYKLLPQSLRDPVDRQMRERTGFTVSELLDPNTPVGAALNSLDQFRSSGDRGVILIDAEKQ